jgi:hypothetical protein
VQLVVSEEMFHFCPNIYVPYRKVVTEFTRISKITLSSFCLLQRGKRFIVSSDVQQNVGVLKERAKRKFVNYGNG